MNNDNPFKPPKNEKPNDQVSLWQCWDQHAFGMTCVLILASVWASMDFGFIHTRNYMFIIACSFTLLPTWATFVNLKNEINHPFYRIIIAVATGVLICFAGMFFFVITCFPASAAAGIFGVVSKDFDGTQRWVAATIVFTIVMLLGGLIILTMYLLPRRKKLNDPFYDERNDE